MAPCSEWHSFLIWCTFGSIICTCLSIFSYQETVSCELHSLNITYQQRNASLECIPIEFDTSLPPCDEQTQGYCYDGSSVCFMRPFYETIIKYSVKSSRVNNIREGIMVMKGLHGFPNASIMNLENTHFNCYVQFDGSPPNTNRLHEGHTSSSEQIAFILYLVLAIVFGIPIIFHICRYIRSRIRYDQIHFVDPGTL
jgi:hypothetical protein